MNNLNNNTETDHWINALNSWFERGFKIVYQNHFNGDYGIEDEMILYRNGFIIYMESFTSEDEPKSMNKSCIYGEIANNPEVQELLTRKFIDRRFGMSINESGNIDVTGFSPYRNIVGLDGLFSNCQPISPWTRSSSGLFLVNYEEEDQHNIEELSNSTTIEASKKFNSITNRICKSKIEQFVSEEAKLMLGFQKRKVR